MYTGQLTSSSKSSILYFPSLPFSLFTYIWPDGLLTEMESQVQLSQQQPRHRRQALWSGHHGGTCLRNSIRIRVNYKGFNRGSANGRGPTRGGRERRKTTETESRSSLSTVYACTEQPPDANQSDRSMRWLRSDWLAMLRSDWLASAIIQFWREISLCTRKL